MLFLSCISRLNCHETPSFRLTSRETGAVQNVLNAANCEIRDKSILDLIQDCKFCDKNYVMQYRNVVHKYVEFPGFERGGNLKKGTEKM